MPLWGTAPHNLGPFLRPSSCWCWCFETGAYGRRLARRAPLLNRRRPVASHRGSRSPQRGASRHRVRRRGRGLRRRVRHLPGRRRADAVPPPTRMELLPGHVPPSARALLRAHGLAVALPSAPQAHLRAIVSAPAWWMNAQSPPTYGHLSGRSGQGGETQHPQLIPRRARAPPGARGNLAAVARALRRPCRARCDIRFYPVSPACGVPTTPMIPCRPGASTGGQTAQKARQCGAARGLRTRCVEEDAIPRTFVDSRPGR